MTTLSGENYQVTYAEDENTLILDGTLRLRGLDEYKDISHLLDHCLSQNQTVVLNVKKLDFLNSSGIAMLSQFVIRARKADNIKLIIQGSVDIPWQSKSLKNLQRLMPELELNIN